MQDRPTITPTKNEEQPTPTPNAPPPEPTRRPVTAMARLKREDATRLAIARHEYPQIGRAMAQRICLHRQDFQTPLVGKRGKKRGG